MSVPELGRADDLFALARTVIASTWPYLTRAVMRMAPRWNVEVPTLGVDRHGRLYLNPAYVNSLSVSQLALLIAGHELQHFLGDHSDRLTQYRNDELGHPSAAGASFANICNDLAINSGLEAFVASAKAYRSLVGAPQIEFKLPDDGVYPHMFCDCNGTKLKSGLFPEEYAELLKHQMKPGCGRPQPGGSGSGSGKNDPSKPGSGTAGADKAGKSGERRTCGSGGGDAKQPWEDPSEPDPTDPSTGVTETERDAIRASVAQAALDQESRMRGTVPGGQRRWAEIQLRPSKLPWQQLLRRAVRLEFSRLTGQSDYTWSRLSRRSGPAVLLPGMHRPEPDFVVGFDTSGSMGKSDIQNGFIEFHALLKALGCPRVPVLVCDAAVSDVQLVSRIEDVTLTGGGGTDMRVLISAAAELKKRMLVLFTDCETPWPEHPVPGMRVLVCATRKNAPKPPDWIVLVECED